MEKCAANGCELSYKKLGRVNAIITASMNTQKSVKVSTKAPLSVRLKKTCDGANNGCASSNAKLVALKKSCGTECSDDLAKKVAYYEKCAANGCEASAKKLVSLEAAFSGKAISVKAKKASECQEATECQKKTIEQ